jgi:hypothetical protein
MVVNWQTFFTGQARARPVEKRDRLRRFHATWPHFTLNSYFLHLSASALHCVTMAGA